MEQVSCSADNPCTAVQLLTQTVNNHHERMERMDSLIESMRNRLPLWATMALAASGTVIGYLVNIALRK